MYLDGLSKAFWLAVMEDLAKGELSCRLWLDTGEDLGGFLWWCETTDKQPIEWTGLLMRLWGLRGTEQAARVLKVLREAM